MLCDRWGWKIFSSMWVYGMLSCHFLAVISACALTLIESSSDPFCQCTLYRSCERNESKRSRHADQQDSFTNFVSLTFCLFIAYTTVRLDICLKTNLGFPLIWLNKWLLSNGRAIKTRFLLKRPVFQMASSPCHAVQRGFLDNRWLKTFVLMSSFYFIRAWV